MRTSDHLQIVGVVELFRNILTKGVTSTSRIHSPTCSVIRVRPEEVAHGSLVWYFLESFEGANVVEGFNAGRESSMKAEELIFDYCSEG